MKQPLHATTSTDILSDGMSSGASWSRNPSSGSWRPAVIRKKRVGSGWKKNQTRAVFRCVAFLGLIAVYGVANHVWPSSTQSATTNKNPASRQLGSAVPLRERSRHTNPDEVRGFGSHDARPLFAPQSGSRVSGGSDLELIAWEEQRRRMETNETNTTCTTATSAKAHPSWLLVFYIVGVLYMFLALAIVCDEFFVPALEEMSSERQLNLSMDVAGATLMAAGGSAPELFTSLFGTFEESQIGFGTIVGSAVFNVLFVIAMCSLLSKETLSLTWWPLFRDSVYYSVGLLCLALFVGVVSPGEIQTWEAVVLLVLYLGYVSIMYFNQRIYRLLTGKELSDVTGQEGGAAVGEGGSDVERAGAYGADSSGRPALSQATVSFRWPATFRAGVLKLLRDPDSWTETAGVGIVSKIAGDVDHVFKQVDMNGDGNVDREELEHLFEKLDCHVTAAQLDEVMRELDGDNDGLISEKEFTAWYIRSEQRIKARVKTTFEQFDADGSGTIDREEVKRLLERLEPRVTDSDVDDALAAMWKEGSPDEISFDEFASWYMNSMIYEKQMKKVEEEFEGVCESLAPPEKGTFFDYVKWVVVFPLAAPLTLTIPDTRKPGAAKFAVVSFFLSIAWIGGYAYFMVDWAEKIGATVGIPSVVMGLTFLAAGTSVPDLISSVIVARRGEGDMAVSSSIGSNIFDILVGLPVPWIIFTAWPTTSSIVEISADGVESDILILLGMLVFIIIAIHCQKWKLTKTLGFLMFLFYFVFLAQAIAKEWPFGCSE